MAAFANYWQRLVRGWVRVAAIAGLGVWLLAPAGSWAADTLPPTVPGNFQATVASGDPEVTLSWDASTDASGIKAYRLDRSLDQSAWSTLSSAISSPGYHDTTTGFGLHYFYRLSAIDMAGNSSGWAATDVSTDEVGGGVAVSSEATYSSSDKLAVVQLPAGLAASEISCTVDSLLNINGKKAGTSSQPAVRGPYQLTCKTPAGSVVTDYKKEVVWTIDLKGALQGLHDPTAYAYNSKGEGAAVKGGQFDPKSQALTVTLPADAIVTVAASRPQTVLSLSWIAIFLVIVGIVAGIVIFAMNRKKKLEHDEYLRSKYYNL
jgi:hypothetical protein